MWVARGRWGVPAKEIAAYTLLLANLLDCASTPYQQILTLLSCGVITIDASGRVVTDNYVALTLLGESFG